MEINKIIKAKQENSENINKFLTLFIVMITICISLILRLRYGAPAYGKILDYFSNYDFIIIFACLIKDRTGTSLAVQRLRLCTSKARDASSPLVNELRSHMLQGTAKTYLKKKKDIRVHQGTKQKEGRTHGANFFLEISPGILSSVGQGRC